MRDMDCIVPSIDRVKLTYITFNFVTLIRIGRRVVFFSKDVNSNSIRKVRNSISGDFLNSTSKGL